MVTGKKRKVTDEGRIFKEQWTEDYFFTCYNGKPICLICKENLSVVKEYNLKRPIVEKLCPEKIKLFQSISLSVRTVKQRIEDLRTTLREELKEKAK
jgi:hypothetical protein